MNKISKAYKTKYTNPVTLIAGEEVKLMEEEQEEKWKGWIWAETGNNDGWIPKQIIDFSEDKKSGIIKENYTAQELDAEAGDFIEIKNSLNGWSWAENLRTLKEGWIPDENIEF